MATTSVMENNASQIKHYAMYLLVVALCVVLFSVVFSSMAHAGTGGGDGFDNVWAAISEYLKGTMGRVLVGLIVIVGVAAGVVRQSLMSFAVAVGAAIGLFYSPEIIEGIITSTHAVRGLVLPIGM